MQVTNEMRVQHSVAVKHQQGPSQQTSDCIFLSKRWNAGRINDAAYSKLTGSTRTDIVATVLRRCREREGDLSEFILSAYSKLVRMVSTAETQLSQETSDRKLCEEMLRVQGNDSSRRKFEQEEKDRQMCLQLAREEGAEQEQIQRQQYEHQYETLPCVRSTRSNGGCGAGSTRRNGGGPSSEASSGRQCKRARVESDAQPPRSVSLDLPPGDDILSPLSSGDDDDRRSGGAGEEGTEGEELGDSNGEDGQHTADLMQQEKGADDDEDDDEDEGEDECAICLESVDNPQVLPLCGHEFCMPCLQSLQERTRH
jgi:hypothetical protein